MPKARKFRYVYRDADTGHFCTAEYAKANPKTTIRQRIRMHKGC